jgi:PAS domain S-box-containing protein
MFGYQAADIIGKPMATLFPTRRHQEAETLSRRIGQGEVITSFDTELVRKDQREVAVAFTVSPVRTKVERSSQPQRLPPTQLRARGWRGIRPCWCTN